MGSLSYLICNTPFVMLMTFLYHSTVSVKYTWRICSQAAPQRILIVLCIMPDLSWNLPHTRSSNVWYFHYEITGTRMIVITMATGEMYHIFLGILTHGGSACFCTFAPKPAIWTMCLLTMTWDWVHKCLMGGGMAWLACSCRARFFLYYILTIIT